MARFIFKLDSVLRHRLQVERERQRDLSIVQGQITTLERELAAIAQMTTDSLEDLRKHHLVGRIDVGFLTAHRRYMLAVQRKTSGIVAEIALATQRANTARASLAQAAMQRKMLEKLREKQKQAWIDAQSRKDLAQADDVGMRLAFTEFGRAEQEIEITTTQTPAAATTSQMQREDRA